MKRKHAEGFTLIEVIVTIVISSLALAALMPLLGRVFLSAHEPAQLLGDAIDLRAAMETLSAQHAETGDLAGFKMMVGAEGEMYADGLVVAENRYVWFDDVNRSEQLAVTNLLLKVTLQNSLGERLSCLFAEDSQ